jgi:N-acyl-D-aspartate/D-glutamate deacylase
VGTVCDASFSTFMLTHWVQQQGLFSVQQAVQHLSARNADYLGLHDRGRIRVGQRADLNLIDPSRLSLPKPQLVRDLPAGGQRFVQTAHGFVHTWVAGQCVQSAAQITPARPGRLVRGGTPR